MPTTANSITYFVAADGTLRDGQQGSISQTPRINYGTEYSVTLTFPASTIAEGDQLQVAVNRSRTFFSSASATGDAPVAAVAKHEVTAEEAAAQSVTLTLSTNTRAMIDQVNGIDHPVRGFFGVHVLRGQSFISLAIADAFMLSVESGPDAISPSLPVVDYPTREEAEALTDRSEAAAERAEQAAAGIVPPLQLDAPPTTSTVGSVGQLAVYHDATTGKDHLYHLCFVSEGDSATFYHWEECVLVSMGNVAGGYAALDENGLVSRNKLPIATASLRGAVVINSAYGVSVNSNGVVSIARITNAQIDSRTAFAIAIIAEKLDYAVRSVLPLVTEIPAATSDYSLVDSSATTLNHSHTFSHSPSAVPTYRLPQVTNTTIAHYIELTVDFTAVQTYSFLDYQGEPIVPLFTPSIAAGDVYTFKMEYSAIKAAWLIYPQKQGAVADDFVMRGEVGAANGVPSLDANAKVPYTQLPYATTSNAGVVKSSSTYGFDMQQNGLIAISGASGIVINSRGSAYRPITPANLNTAVTAALTDSNKISLTDAQKATAQSVFGVGGPITEIPAATSEYTLSEGIFKHAPTNAPTYNLPSITDTIRSHVIVLAIDFSSVQTFSFVPPQDSGVTFQSYANPNLGDVWVFRCVWYGGKWRIAPMKIKNCVTRQLTSGALAITDAVAGDALALKMTAPRSVVLNQHIDTTDTFVTLTSGRTWLTYIGGVSEKVTGTGQSVACTGGTDMAVDLTQYFNGDRTLINSIQTWDDLVAYDPRFASYVEYNTGTVTGVQPTVKVTGSNLFNVSAITNTRDLAITNNVISTSAYSISTDVRLRTLIGNVPVGTQITVSCDRKLVTGPAGGNTGQIVCYGTGVSLLPYMIDTTPGVSYHATNTVIVTKAMLDATVFIYGNSAYSDEGNVVEFTDLRINIGDTELPYEPYHDGGTAQAPTPLFAVGNAADEFEAVSGTTTVLIGNYTFTGEETFGWSSTLGAASTFVIRNNKHRQGGTLALCNTLVRSSRTQITSVDSGYFLGAADFPIIEDALYIKIVGCNSASDVAAWLAQHPTTIYYELATSTTSSSTPTQISLQAGSNVAMQTDGGRLAPIDITYESDEL